MLGRTGRIALDRLEKQIGSLDTKFDAHAEKVNTRLASGDTLLALMDQSIKAVKGEVTTLRTELKEQSDKIRQVQPKGDRTPQATPALTPKAEKPEQPRIVKIFWKGLETAIGAAMSVLLVGGMIYIFKGKAAALIADPTSAPAPSSPTTP